MLSTVTAASTRFARPIVSRLATATQQSTKTKFHCHFSSVSNTSSKMTLTTLPSVSVLQGFPDPQSINLSDYCAGKNILLIGLPGAFTPTWSATQVPGYLEKQEELKAAGIEEVIVYCVNDPAVSKFSACCVEWMNESDWKLSLKVLLLNCTWFPKSSGVDRCQVLYIPLLCTHEEVEVGNHQWPVRYDLIDLHES